MSAVSAQPYLPGLQKSSGWQRLQAGLFWVWNIIFLSLAVFGFAPLQMPELIRTVREGLTPPVYLAYAAVLIGIPVAATVIAALFLRKQPERLFALGYVVEWPLLLIFIFRFFIIREGNPAISVMLAWLAVAEAAFLWRLLDRRDASSRRDFPPVTGWSYLRLAGLTLLFAGTIYAAVWLLFYVPPVAAFMVEMIKNIGEGFRFQINNFTHWYDIPLFILVMVLYVFSASLIVVMPVAAPILAGRAWWSSLQTILNRRILDAPDDKKNRLPAALASMLLPLALVLAVWGLSMRQPQKAAFDLLAQPPANPQQALALIEHEDAMRAGLLNSYLASYRYLGSAGQSGYLSDMYNYTVGLRRDTATKIERWYEVVIRPFLYQPVNTEIDNNRTILIEEQREAAELYERYFDQPIATGERESIVDAVRATSNGSQAELAWQEVDDREVHLNQQEVTLSEHGDWAEVLIHEVYQNRTSQRQEVVYYFSLPESAVITGLWLGNTPNRDEAFAFQVAPRGAAQAVYQNEVRYRRDPALVEQIGPRQYRLRAFPVEPRTWSPGAEEISPGPELHLWMQYRTLSAGGAWPLPRLAELRNVYWDKNSARSLNGVEIAGTDEAWLPASAAASQPVTPRAHRVDFGGVSVLAAPAAAVQAAQLPDGLRAAVVLDRSFSMRDRAGEVTQAMESITRALGAGTEPHIYLTASEYRGEAPDRVSLASFKPDEVIYLGGQNAAELLAQFEALSSGEEYDLILVLTDGSGYELGDGDIAIRVPDAPLWVVHLGGGFPLGYDDATQQAIQASGGGAAASVDEALARYAAGLDAAPGTVDIVDGYTWQTVGTESAATDAAADEAGFAALAARRVLLAEMAKNKGSLEGLAVLDDLHALAVDQGIVTPYSSMIVLVDRRQQELLDALSKKDDRFLRELEDIGLTQENVPMGVTGVPEPEEWLLIGMAAALLVWANRKKMGIRRLGY